MTDVDVIEATKGQLNAARWILKETEERIRVLEQQREAAARGGYETLLAQLIKSLDEELNTARSTMAFHEQRARELEALLRTME